MGCPDGERLQIGTGIAMKICMIVPDASVKGGIASVVNGYRGSVIERNHEIHYVESYKDGSKFTKLWKALCGYFHFLITLVTNRPDIVHIHSSFGPSFYRKMPFIYLSSLAKIPVVNHIHGAEFDSFYEKASAAKQRRVRRVYRKCTRFIVLSKEWKEKIAQIVPADRIDRIENYCILPEEPYDVERRRNQILFLGALEERKGCYDMPVIFEAVKQKCPDARLVMAGDGQMKRIKEAFAKKNLLSDVEFPGWVRNREKAKLLEQSALFLFPSYNEGMPMAVLEAMSYGMGIVTTTIGGIPQLISHRRSGYLETPGDLTAMAEDVCELLQDEELRRNMGRRARETVEQNYSLKLHLQKLEETYRKACLTK